MDALAGEGLLAGIELAIEEANEAGGVNGRQLELVTLDDGFDIPRNVANMRRLVEEENVYAIVSPAGSQALPGSWELIEETGTIVLQKPFELEHLRQALLMSLATRLA